MQGYETATEKSRRAAEEGRLRRMHAVLTQAGMPPTWTPVCSPAGNLASQKACQSYSPAAEATRKRAARLPAGFDSQLCEQLVAERNRLDFRLQAIAAACEISRHAYAIQHGCNQVPHAPSYKLSHAQTVAWPSAELDVFFGTPFPAQTFNANHPNPSGSSFSNSQKISLHRPTIPPTVVRPHTQLLTTPASKHQTAQAPPSKQSGPMLASDAEPAAVPQAQHTPMARTTGGPREAASARPSTRRRLLFDNNLDRNLDSSSSTSNSSCVSGASITTRTSSTSASHSTHSTSTPSLVQSLPHRQPAAAVLKTPSRLATGSGTSRGGPRTAPAEAPTVRTGAGGGGGSGPMADTEVLLEPAQAAAGGQNLSAATGMRAYSDELFGSARDAPGRQAWQPTPELLPNGTMQPLAGGGAYEDALHAAEAEVTPARFWSPAGHTVSLLGHRERLRAGIAELNAELCSSWRALVASGAV